LIFLGHINQNLLNVMFASSFSRPFEEVLAEVGRDNMNIELGHCSGERAITASNLWTDSPTYSARSLSVAGSTMVQWNWLPASPRMLSQKAAF
jgi:hypothetical protein